MEGSRSDITNEAVSTSNVTPTSVPNYYSLNTPQTQNIFNYAPNSQIPMGNFNFDGVNTPRPQNFTYGNTNYLQSLSSGFPAMDSNTLSQLSNLAQVSFPPSPSVSMTPTQNTNIPTPVSNWAIPTTPYHPPTQSMPAPATPEMNAIRAVANSERRRNSIPFSFIGGGSIGQSNLHISSGAATSTAQRQENAYSRARGMSLMSTVSVGVAASCGKRKQMEDEHHIIPFQQPIPSNNKMNIQGDIPTSLQLARAKRRPSISAIDVDSLKRPRIEEPSSNPATPAAPEPVASPAPAASPAPTPPASEKRKPAYAFFAVYDGHGGTACAEYVRMNLHNNIATHPDFSTDVEKAINEGFAKTEKDFAEENGTANCGTTACVALIYENILYVANVGDSAGLICRKGKAVPLTTPHTLKAPQERERVEAAGGVIFDNRLAHPIWNPELINIGVTRAFGDLYFKDEQYTLGKESGLIATPEISKFPLTNEDKFVILATDGFWDHVTLQETVDYVLKEKVTNAKIICKNLTDLAAKKAGSTLDDNATVLLIKLKGDEDDAPRPPPLFSSTSNLAVPSDNNTESSSKPTNLTLTGANSSTSELSSDSSSSNSTSTTTEPTTNSTISNHSEITHSTSNDGKNPISATVSEQSSPSSVYGTISTEPSKQTMADEEFRNRSSEKLSELSHSAIETKVN